MRQTTLAALLTVLLGCGPMPREFARPVAHAPISSLYGKWYVVATNFPMWLTGKKTRPAFTYGPLDPLESGAERMSDEVSYTAERGEETLRGVDTEDLAAPGHFEWRGEGILLLFASNWEILHVSADGRWAVIHFSETVATPEGVDVVSREPHLDAATFDEATRFIAGDPELADVAHGLVNLSDRQGAAPRAR